jgi:hypothetical protein
MNKSMPKEQRNFVLKEWWTSGKTYQVLSNTFQNEYPNEKVPSRQAIYQLVKKWSTNYGKNKRKYAARF